MHLSEELLHPVDVLRPGGLGMPGGSQGGLLLLVILPSGLGEVVEEVGRRRLELSGEVEEEMNRVYREVEASKATISSLEEKRRVEREETEKRRKSELAAVEEKRRVERGEAEKVVAELKERLEEVEEAQRVEVRVDITSLFEQVGLLREQLTMTEAELETTKVQS